jgi:hypothetical protein
MGTKPMTVEQIIATLYSWLGQSAILLPIPLKSKNPGDTEWKPGTKWLGWQETTFEKTQTQEYQSMLKAAVARGGNVGVLLIDGLVSIDVDLDERVDEFASTLNPRFSNTLQSRGRRGRNIWLRMVGEYPRAQAYYVLKTIDGKKWGEWRCWRSQTIIFGEHPDSTPATPIRYSCLCRLPPLETRFEDIPWPPDLILSWAKTKPETPPSNNNHIDVPNLHERILAYLAAIPAALSGNGGDKQTFTVACALVNGWALTAEQAMPYMQVYSAKCEPPWRDKELQHKLAKAETAAHDKPRGHLIGCSYRLKKPDADKGSTAEHRVDPGPENDCPYPAIDWSSRSNGKSNPIFHHPAIYPEDSILQPFMEMSRLVCEGADCYLIGSILPVIAALLERRVWTPWSEGRKLYPICIPCSWESQAIGKRLPSIFLNKLLSSVCLMMRFCLIVSVLNPCSTSTFEERTDC